jgi:DNA-binding HxlR family transcriptional regulator
MVCAVVKTSKIVGRKWSIPIFEEIVLGKFDGFNSFLSKSGGDITPRILSRQLKELEEEGIIKKVSQKKDRQTITRYVVTPKGREIHNLIIDIKKWNIKWNKTPEVCLSTSCADCKAY